ncbi:MAG: addiction module protein [Phycisphaerales bacterium JB063]
MVSKATRDELLRLSPAQRIQVVQDLWDSIADQSGAVALSDAQRAVLDERLAAYEADPDAGSTWEEIRERIPRASQD